MDAITPYKANDKFRTSLRSTWIASPADTSLLVSAIPTNTPTIVVVGWNTDYETVFSVAGTSGTSSADYALTGVARIKGENANIPENTAVNCLNNEEFFNQYGTSINEVITATNEAVATVEALDTIVNGGVTTVTDGATMLFDLADGANRKFKCTLTTARTFTIDNVTAGTPFIVRITQPAIARVVTWFTGITITWQGTSGTTVTDILANKTGTYGFIAQSATTLDGYFLGAEV
jgi:hypothetical protein